MIVNFAKINRIPIVRTYCEKKMYHKITYKREDNKLETKCILCRSLQEFSNFKLFLVRVGQNNIECLFENENIGENKRGRLYGGLKKIKKK